jgi:ribonucleoside-diphosphate reductase alpha chain
MISLTEGEFIEFSTKIFDNLTDGLIENCKKFNLKSDLILSEFIKNIPSKISLQEAYDALLMSIRTQFELEPDYSYIASQLLLEVLHLEVNTLLSVDKDYFKNYVQFGIDKGFLDPKLAEFDLDKLSNALVPDRDSQFKYLGIQTLYDRYLLHWQDTRFELPQAFFMRVAMGLALNETDKESRAIEFYNELSQFNLMCSTPTLFNAGTVRPQLSSCYISTVPDSAEGITKVIADNALLSKYAGGIGNDWTQVRGMGAHIKGTNGKSQGVIPFMKIAEATLIAFNQSGRRRGSGCAYLESWHIDIEEFLELRKNTGDHRRRTHDMSSSNWIPDEFMIRVHEDRQWTLFSPDEVPDLHDLYGKAFSERYAHYERLADAGEIKLFKRISAVELWRKMLTMLFETGHPFICFKDPCNIRNPQQHVGVVHSSNLCTEIIENTSSYETAVCNLASINLANHVSDDGEIDYDKIANTVKIGMRMLDNVIDINFYPIPEARDSNSKHRPVGLGLMGLQDALYKLRVPFDSDDAVELNDEIMELVSFHAIASSTELARERGCYETFAGSLWSQGILPIDSIELLAQQRGKYLDLDRSSTLDWESLREQVKTVGMRNSNCMAIAPTATISNICGVSQSIEPSYQNLFVKTNLSGDFTVINPYLVNDLKALGLWDDVMINDLKYFDGSIQGIKRIPNELKTLYLQAFEIDPIWIVKAASRRQKWIDQSQSLNLYLSEPSGRKLDNLYKLAWIMGLKTTYYLRTLGATRVQKNTIQQCSIDDPECESCQ